MNPVPELLRCLLLLMFHPDPAARHQAEIRYDLATMQAQADERMLQTQGWGTPSPRETATKPDPDTVPDLNVGGKTEPIEPGMRRR